MGGNNATEVTGLTVAGIASGDYVQFQVKREGNHVNDTCNGASIDYLGAWVQYGVDGSVQ